MKITVRLGPGVTSDLSLGAGGGRESESGPDAGGGPQPGGGGGPGPVRVEPGQKKGEFIVELPDNASVRNLVERLGVKSPENLLVIVNGRVPPADTPLSHGDQVMIVYPLSGG